MFNYTSQKQLEIFEFKTQFESKLDPNNRWVKMAKLLDWDKFAEIYAKNFSTTKGVESIDARVVIGSLIIKHIEGKDDRGTIEMIQENPYMQYFLGLDQFSSKPVFDPSLFVHIRKRLGSMDFDKMNQIIIAKVLNLEQREEKLDNQKQDKEDSDKPKNKGKLQLDATVADAHIKYPTDLSLLNDAREKSEEIIDRMCETLNIPKPRTYRREARKSWLNLSKSKKKTKKQIQTGIKQQLGYLKRNLKHIDNLIDNNSLALGTLNKKQYKYLLVIKELNRQQSEMFTEKKHTIENRIVSIHQPHIRPIVRGKQGKTVEFGSKINVSLYDGYSRTDQMSFEAFNEGKFMVEQVENYKKLTKYYPELVQTDGLYLTKENRKYLKENNIRHTGKPLGRRPKEQLDRYQKEKLKKERGERNHIEGKFGQGKAKYKLNKIMAKLEQTSQSWVAAILFVMNILKLTKEYFCALFYHLFFYSISENNYQKSRTIPLFLKN